MTRIEHEAKARGCMSCGETHPTVLIAVRSSAGEGFMRLCIRRCWPLVVGTAAWVVLSPPGHAETSY